MRDDDRKALAEVIRKQAARGKYQMPGDRLPYEAWSLGVADAVIAYLAAQPVTDFEAQVRAERERQIEKGYTAEHDDAHGADHLLMWATEYAKRGEPVKSWALIEAARESLLRSRMAEYQWGIQYGDEEGVPRPGPENRVKARANKAFGDKVMRRWVQPLTFGPWEEVE